jgi:hypothetical protein
MTNYHRKLDSSYAIEAELARPNNFRTLWRCVIVNAFKDADTELGPRAKSWNRKAVESAKEWLTTDSAHLRAICEYAEIDKDKLLRTARERYKATDANKNEH